MAKQQVAVVDKDTGEILEKDQSDPRFEVSQDFMSDMENLPDLGYSDRAEDAMIPILSIIQDNSGEAKKGHSKKIEGAEPGFLIIRSLGRVIETGDNVPPVPFQPCGFQHVWVEWDGEPGDGAPVMQYPFEERPADATEQVDPTDEEKKRTIWRMPNGNRLVDTRYHYGHLLGDDGELMALVVPMSGTNHSVSRQWTAQMKQFKLPGRPGQRAPAFMRAYGLTTKFTQRGNQSWYKYSVSDMGWIRDETVLRSGMELLRAVHDQTVTADLSTAAEAAAGGEPAVADDEIPI